MSTEIIDLEDTIIIDIEDKDPIILNETASEIFRLMKKNITNEDILKNIFSKYNVSDEDKSNVTASIIKTISEIKSILGDNYE